MREQLGGLRRNDVSISQLFRITAANSQWPIRTIFLRRKSGGSKRGQSWRTVSPPPPPTKCLYSVTQNSVITCTFYVKNCIFEHNIFNWSDRPPTETSAPHWPIKVDMLEPSLVAIRSIHLGQLGLWPVHTVRSQLDRRGVVSVSVNWLLRWCR